MPIKKNNGRERFLGQILALETSEINLTRSTTFLFILRDIMRALV